MFLYKLLIPGRTKKGSPNIIKLSLLQCDQCSSSFVYWYGTNVLRKRFNFCSNLCQNAAQRKGGILDQSRKQTYLENWGVDHPMKTSEGRQLFKEGMKEIHGIEHPSNSQAMLNTRRENYKLRTGFDFPLQNPSVKEKSKATSRIKYGADCFAASEVGRQKMTQATLDKYGVTCSLIHPDVRAKTKQTNLERRGVEHPSQDPTVTKRIWETRSKNGKHGIKISKPEKILAEKLRRHFGESDLQLQKFLFGHPFDMHLLSQNLLIEMDGVYWHGYTLNVLDPDARQDIVEFSLRDLEINKQCRLNNLNLCRVTDTDLWELIDRYNDQETLEQFWNFLMEGLVCSNSNLSWSFSPSPPLPQTPSEHEHSLQFSCTQ